MITSLLCYVTIWNSPAEVTGASTVDDSAKKGDKGDHVISVLVFMDHLNVNKMQIICYWLLLLHLNI